MNAKRLLSPSLVTLASKWKGERSNGVKHTHKRVASKEETNALNRTETKRTRGRPNLDVISIGIAYPTWKNSHSLVAAYHANSWRLGSVSFSTSIRAL